LDPLTHGPDSANEGCHEGGGRPEEKSSKQPFWNEEGKPSNFASGPKRSSVIATYVSGRGTGTPVWETARRKRGLGWGNSSVGNKWGKENWELEGESAGWISYWKGKETIESKTTEEI